MNMNTYMIESFLSNVGKLDKFVHRQTHDEQFGTVRLVKAAYESKYGKRIYSVSKSKLIPSGSYTIGGLRKKMLEA